MISKLQFPYDNIQVRYTAPVKHPLQSPRFKEQLAHINANGGEKIPIPNDIYHQLPIPDDLELQSVEDDPHHGVRCLLVPCIGCGKTWHLYDSFLSSILGGLVECECGVGLGLKRVASEEVQDTPPEHDDRGRFEEVLMPELEQAPRVQPAHAG